MNNTCTYVQTLVCVYVHMYVCVYMYACMCMRMYEYMYMYVHMCVNMHACTYICIYVCICIYTNKRASDTTCCVLNYTSNPNCNFISPFDCCHDIISGA